MKTDSQICEARRRETRSARASRFARRNPVRGVSTLEVTLMLPFLLLLLIGVVDFGQLFHLAIEVSNAARAGAQYGYQNSATQADTAGMVAAAQDDASDVTTWGTNVATYGCMCSDGTSQSQIGSSSSSSTTLCATPPSSCTSKGTQLINYVQVQTQATYTPFFPWPGAPSSITLNGQAMYWAAQ
ncbi:MAG: TadE/TadG family type IV pilus assembly protein [Candidatus Acidiferrales bacterium]